MTALPVPWFDRLARVLTEVEEVGVAPEDRPLCVLSVVYRIWASARMMHLEERFRSWVPDSVYGAGCGRGSVEAREYNQGGTEGYVGLVIVS